MRKFEIKTEKRYQLVDITDRVEKAVREVGKREGVVLVFVPHSTAGVLVTENERGLKRDWLRVLKDLAAGYSFEHDRIDDNADSHLLSGLVGQSRTLPVNRGELSRGTWQQVFVAEFDGPRRRKVWVQVS